MTTRHTIPRIALLTLAALVAVALATSAAAAAEPPWQEMPSGAPLTEGVLVYDSDNHLVVAYGGRDKHVNKTSDPSDALRVFDVAHEGGQWVDVSGRVKGLAPGEIFGSAAVYWPTRRQVVLFGGSGNKGLVVLDMSRGLRNMRWIRPSLPGAEAARSSHSAVYAPELDTMLVFGGTRGNTADGSLTLDDVVAVTPSGSGFLARQLVIRGERPPARYDHSAVYDPANRRMIVFGGQRSRREAAYDDVWALDMREPGYPTWVQLGAGDREVSGPGRRAAHSAVYDPLRQQMVVYGGKGPSAKDLWVLPLADPSAGLSWERTVAGDVPGAPGAPSDHGAVWVPDQDCLIVYGGSLRGNESSAMWMHHPADSAGHNWAPAPPPGCDPLDIESACGASLAVKVYLDTRCDGFFTPGYDWLLSDATVTVAGAFGAAPQSGLTNGRGSVYFDGLDVTPDQPLSLVVEHPAAGAVCGYGGSSMTVPADRFGHDGSAVVSIGLAPSASTSP
jgi:hypothetical protein